MSPRTPNITKGRYTPSMEYPPTHKLYQKSSNRVKIKNRRYSGENLFLFAIILLAYRICDGLDRGVFYK